VKAHPLGVRLLHLKKDVARGADPGAHLRVVVRPDALDLLDLGALEVGFPQPPLLLRLGEVTRAHADLHGLDVIDP